MKNDRIIGYTVIAAVLLLLVFPIVYLYLQTTTPKTYRTIEFRNVKGLSFLSVQDPVRILGVEVGVIRKIESTKTAALVTIETEHTIKIFNDYRIEVLAKGVMGERYLTITTGTPSQGEVPPEVLLHGTTSIGPDEALSYINQLVNAVHTLKIMTETLKTGEHGKASLIDRTWQIASGIDSIVGTLHTVIFGISGGFTVQIGMITDLLEKTDSISTSLSDSLQGTVRTANGLIADTQQLLERTETLLAQISAAVEKIDNPDLMLWKKNTSTLSAQLTDLQNILRQLQGDSVTIPVRLW